MSTVEANAVAVKIPHLVIRTTEDDSLASSGYSNEFEMPDYEPSAVARALNTAYGVLRNAFCSMESGSHSDSDGGSAESTPPSSPHIASAAPLLLSSDLSTSSTDTTPTADGALTDETTALPTLKGSLRNSFQLAANRSSRIISGTALRVSSFFGKLFQPKKQRRHADEAPLLEGRKRGLSDALNPPPLKAYTTPHAPIQRKTTSTSQVARPPRRARVIRKECALVRKIKGAWRTFKTKLDRSMTRIRRKNRLGQCVVALLANMAYYGNRIWKAVTCQLGRSSVRMGE